jgi:hypothetical protein
MHRFSSIDDPVRAPDIEQSTRSAGLLTDGRPINQCKVLAPARAARLFTLTVERCPFSQLGLFPAASCQRPYFQRPPSEPLASAAASVHWADRRHRTRIRIGERYLLGLARHHLDAETVCSAPIQSLNKALHQIPRKSPGFVIARITANRAFTAAGEQPYSIAVPGLA